MADASGQAGFLFLLLGLIVILLFYLISRVSSLTRAVISLKKSLKDAETNIIAQNTISAPIKGAAAAVPNAVIAAISAAVNQYRTEFSSGK